MQNGDSCGSIYREEYRLEDLIKGTGSRQR
jgi:hypothetical protein